MGISDEASRGPGGAQFVVVANRLPVRRVEHDGEMRWDSSPGGLVSALTPALASRAGMWIGWPGDGVELAVPAYH